MNVATALAAVLLIPAAGLGNISGWADMGTVVLVLLLSLGYLTPIIGLVGTLATILVRIRMSAASVTELLAEEPLPEPELPRVPDTFDVEFADVEFGYREDQTVLHDVSIHVPAGTSAAFVGATGSGKSTLARLLARFQDVRAGSVRIGGVDVREIPSVQLARLVSFIQQDEYVFAQSLRENIRIARPGASDAQVTVAAEAAQLADVAAALPNGWETLLSAGGKELSGGERQRIAIARAILKDSPVIVVDEATASLDGVTEQRTLEAMEALTAGRTVLAIAHRLHTITGSAQILVMDEGTIAAQGTHTQLLAEHPPYRDLWEAYTQAAGWRLDTAPGLDREAADAEAVAAEPSAAASSTTTTSDRPAPTTDGPAPAADIVTPGLGRMSFFRQWRTMYGRSWAPLLRRGLIRMILEALLRGAPLLAVLFLVMAGIGALPWGAAGGSGTVPGAGAGAGADGSLLSPGLVWTITGVLAAAMVLRVAANAWANGLVWTLSANSKADLQLSVLDRLRRVPLGYFQRTDTGRVGTLVTSDAYMVDFQNVPQQVIGSLVQPVYAIIILVIVDWRLALAAMCGVPVFWALTVWADRVYHRVFADIHAARRVATTAMLEQARGAAVLRGNPDSAVARSYATAMRGLSRASIDMSVKATPATTLGQMAVECGQVVLIAVGAALFSAGAVSPATLLVFMFLSLTLYQPIQELGNLAGYRRNQQQIAAKVAEVWDAPVLTEPATSADPVEKGAACSVEFRDVSFSYRSGQEPSAAGSDSRLPAPSALTLDGVSFHAEAGQITALVGASGAGKSTVANLVSRLWDVDSGAVLLGGADVRELGSAGVLTRVTTVAQSVYLFDETVRFNLTLGRPEATDQEVWAALRAAQVEDVVAALPDGLDTQVAEGGVDLSGGQRQRLAIARALLKDSPVLVLDEAVASVDPGTEDRIQAALSTLAAGRTVIVIAHRLATVTGVGRIVVMDGGRVAGVGTHVELLDGCPEYRALAKAQGLLTATDPETVGQEAQVVRGWT
jgi:ATP-binding cassette subfamily B protein